MFPFVLGLSQTRPPNRVAPTCLRARESLPRLYREGGPRASPSTGSAFTLLFLLATRGPGHPVLAFVNAVVRRTLVGRPWGREVISGKPREGGTPMPVREAGFRIPTPFLSSAVWVSKDAGAARVATGPCYRGMNPGRGGGQGAPEPWLPLPSRSHGLRTSLYRPEGALHTFRWWRREKLNPAYRVLAPIHMSLSFSSGVLRTRAFWDSSSS